jgi:hypothetical protein
MAKANSVLSTPPTNTPIDTTRRHFLTVAAAGGAALTLPPVRAASQAADPIYEVIESHRKACAAHNEAVDTHMDFEEVGMTGEKLEKYESLVAETDAAHDRLDGVGCDLINTRPTTLAGILALCRYINPLFEEEDSPDLPTYILYDDDTTAPPPKRFAM